MSEAGDTPARGDSARPWRMEVERHQRWLAARMPRGPAAEDGGEKPLVLVVEDEECIRDGLRELLELCGYRVAATGLAEEAIRVAPEIHPDVVLLDLVLPRLSGLEAVRSLKEHHATAAVPVIATTGLWLDGHSETLAAAGFDGSLRKPYSGPELLHELERVLTPSASARAAS